MNRSIVCFPISLVQRMYKIIFIPQKYVPIYFIIGRISWDIPSGLTYSWYCLIMYLPNKHIKGIWLKYLSDHVVWFAIVSYIFFLLSIVSGMYRYGSWGLYISCPQYPLCCWCFIHCFYTICHGWSYTLLYVRIVICTHAFVFFHIGYLRCLFNMVLLMVISLVISFACLFKASTIIWRPSNSAISTASSSQHIMIILCVPIRYSEIISKYPQAYNVIQTLVSRLKRCESGNSKSP